MSKTERVESRHAQRRHEARTAVLRLARWYAVVLVLFVAVWWLLSALPVVPDKEAGSQLPEAGGLLLPSAVLKHAGEEGLGWLAALVQMLAALLLVIPIAGTYVRTRVCQKYDRTLVQTVIVLPVAVTAVLMMVSHSLALAFGLAGVVGAVRFRTNLGEAGDTVYIFTAIVVGFAAGVHAVGVAMILSMLFVALELVMWYWDVASPTARSWRHVSVSGSEPLPLGVPPSEAPDREQLVRIDVGDLVAGEFLATQVLEKRAKQHRVVRRSPTEGRGGSLEYVVRLRKQMGIEELTRRLREAAGETVKTIHWHAAADHDWRTPADRQRPLGRQIR